MSKQSGAELKKLDAASLAEIREDDLEHRYQLAVKWRWRLKTHSQMLADTNKEIIFGHVDNLIEFANKCRGQYLTLRENIKKESDARDKQRKEREKYRKAKGIYK